MSHRQEITEVDPTAGGLDGDISNAMILDHLAPKAQEFYPKPRSLRPGTVALIVGRGTKLFTFGNMKTAEDCTLFHSCLCTVDCRCYTQ